MSLEVAPGKFLGKKAARLGAIRLGLSDYVKPHLLPAVPDIFGAYNKVKDFGMLGNDGVGDCVECDALHGTMLLNAIAGREVAFTTQNALDLYTAVAGYNPSNPDTDQGTDLSAMADYRQKTGILDANGSRHKVAAYLSLRPGNLSDIWTAAYLFKTVSIGVQLPQCAIDQTDAGQEWHTVKGSPTVGGHCVTLVGKRGPELVLVTWGKLQSCTEWAFANWCDEAVAYVSEEFLVAGRSPEGFDLAALRADLAAIGA